MSPSVLNYTVVLVGESNPYGADPYYALYPAPDGCSGHRLCCLIFGMRRKVYIDSFARVNLCRREWSIKEARTKAKSLQENPGRFILLGKKVCDGFGTPFVPFEVSCGGTILVLPHPSGLNRMWAQAGMVEKTRAAVGAFAPKLKPLIGQGEVD